MTQINFLVHQPLTNFKLSLLQRIQWSSQQARAVCDNVQFILQKCILCVDQSLVDALFVLLHCLLHCATQLPQQLCRALNKPLIMHNKQQKQHYTSINATSHCPNESSLQLFAKLTCSLFSRESTPLLWTFDVSVFLQLLQVVCSMSGVKDTLGGLIGQRILIPFMCDTDAHSMDYRLARGCATCVIALLRGSRANKNRFSANVNEFCTCIANSTDVFFQMQCVQILFRLHTHNPTLLLTATSLQDDVLRRSIMSLPNDETLLQRIEECLDGFNSDHHNRELVSFTVLRLTCTDANSSTTTTNNSNDDEHHCNRENNVIVADKNDIMEICKHTTVYFSTSLLIILLPNGSGQNITIPFEHIRSVRLSREHRVTLHLSILPPLLVSIMSVQRVHSTKHNNKTHNAAGEIILHIYVTQSTLFQLQQSPIRNWIARRKRNTPLRPKMYYLSLLPQSSSSSSIQKQQSIQQKDQCKYEYEQEKKLQQQHQQQQQVHSLQQMQHYEMCAKPQNANADLHHDNKKDSCDSYDNDFYKKSCNDDDVVKKSEPTISIQRHNNNQYSSDSNIAYSKVQSVPIPRAQSHSAPLHHLSSSSSSLPSLSALTRSQPAPSRSINFHCKQNTEDASNDSNMSADEHVFNTKDALDEIHRAAAVRVANRVEHINKQRQAALSEIDERINAMCRENARDRAEHETHFRNKMAQFRQVQADMKQFAASCVNSLNSELEQVQQLGSALQHECDVLLEQIAQACDNARNVGDTSLIALRTRAHAHVRSVQEKMQNMLLNVNPLHDLVQKLKTCNALDLPGTHNEMRGTETPTMQITRQKLQRIEQRKSK